MAALAKEQRRRQGPRQRITRQSSASKATTKSQISGSPNMSNKRAIHTINDSDDDDEIQLVKVTPIKKARTSAPTQAPPIAVTQTPAPAAFNSAFPFEITVDVLQKFKDIYPGRTLETNASIYQEEIRTAMMAYQNNQPLPSQYLYTVMDAIATKSGGGFTNTPRGNPTPSKAFANARLLEHFAVTYDIAAPNDKPKFVFMTTRVGMKNPKFAHMHAVRYNEVGCGFDEDGLLSMYMTKLIGGERQVHTLYVQRTETRVSAAPRTVEQEEMEMKDNKDLIKLEEDD